MKKTLLIALAAVVLVIVIAAVTLTMSLGAIVKKSVETFGPKAAGVPITLKTAKVSLLSGKARIEGLTVGNPEGFATPYAFRMGELAVDIDLRSLRTDTIVIRKIRINGPEITLEQSLRGNNIRQIQKHISSGADARKKAAPPEKQEDKEAKPKQEKKVIIEDFLLENGKVTLQLKILKDRSREIGLPAIHLQDIGKASGGATAADAIVQILAAVSGALVDATLDSRNLLDGAAGGIPNEAGTAVAQAEEAAKKGASKVLGGLKGLLEKKE